MNYSEINIRVRYSETDQMGVVHHRNYAIYLEIARTDWLRKLGHSYKSLEENNIMLPVISMQLNYKKSAYYDELIKVKTQLVKPPSVKIIFNYEIANNNDDILVTGSTVLAFINKKTGKPMRCPDYILDKIN